MAWKLLARNYLALDASIGRRIVGSAMKTLELPGVDWRETEESIRWLTFANFWDFKLKAFVDYNDQGQLILRSALQASNDNNKDSIQPIHAQ